MLLASSGTIGALFGTPVAAALVLTGTVAAVKGGGSLWDKLFLPVAAAAAGSVTMHLLGGQSIAFHLPPLGAAVVVLALTGVVLISGEPTRAPFRVIFWVKLALVLVGVLLTWSLPALARRRGVDESGAATADLKLIAVATLFVWAAVIVAGRWIGYANPWPGAPV